jgi:hypothetical protein
MTNLTSHCDLEETGLAYLRLKNATHRAERSLTHLLEDEELEMFAKAEVRSAILILREAME